MEAADASSSGQSIKESELTGSEDRRYLRRTTLSTRSRVWDVNEEAPLLETARRVAHKARSL